MKRRAWAAALPRSAHRNIGLSASGLVLASWLAGGASPIAVASGALADSALPANPRPRQTAMLTLPGHAPLEVVWIPAGTFLMGQRPRELDAYPNKETPQHKVKLTRGFWLGRHEVRQSQWRAVMGTAPWTGRVYASEDAQSPAVYVSWDDAQAFLQRASELSGLSFRLPTEAEWEYACRAGTKTRFHWGDDPAYEQINRAAWWRGNVTPGGKLSAQPAGTKPPNPWGVFDLSGNVSEWCQDWHWFYFDGTVIDPVGPTTGVHRVVRGGSWLTTGGQCRSARRNHEAPDARHSDLGFRVVIAAAPQPEAGTPEFTDVFVAGMDGVNTYRIPSLLVSPDGSLLAFCEARKESQDDASPTDLVLRRSLDGGRTWQPSQVLVRGTGKEALMNPCPVVDHTNRAILLLCDKAHQVGPNRHVHHQLVSRDDGRTWSAPVRIGERIANYDDRFNPGPGVGVQLRSGRLVVPGYTGEVNDETEEAWHARVLYSDDFGRSWTLGPEVAEWTDECQAVELADGTLMLNARGNMGRSCRAVALSRNGGESWSSFRWDRALNECPCQASLARYSQAGRGDKNRLLFSNPDNAGEKFGILERTKLTVRLSYDEGNSWPIKRLIHAGPASYSMLVRLPDGDIGLLFEGGEKHRREWIRFARFSLSWLTQGTDRN